MSKFLKKENHVKQIGVMDVRFFVFWVAIVNADAVDYSKGRDSSAVNFSCPTCSQVMQCADDLAGQKAVCPKCGQKIMIPTPPKPTPTPNNKTTLGKLEGTVSAPPVLLAVAPPQELATSSPIPSVPPPLPTWEQSRSGNSSSIDDKFEDDPRPKKKRRKPARFDDEGDREDYERDNRGKRRSYRACPRCGCTDYPRQTTRFGGASVALLIIGIFFWPLIIVSFLVQEKWDVCPDCGEKLGQTGTGF